MKRVALIARLSICLLVALTLLSGAALLAQSEHKPEVFLGYSNLQAPGLPDTSSLTGLFGSAFFGNRSTLQGFNTQVSAFPTDAFGLTGDFSFNEKGRSASIFGVGNSIKTDILYFMGGPTLTIGHSSRLQPFTHFLAGGAHTRFNVKSQATVFGDNITNSFKTGTTDFALAAGGGLDWRVSDGLKVRLVQVDYAPVFLSDQSVRTLTQAGALIPFTLNGGRMDSVRFSFGIVF